MKLMIAKFIINSMEEKSSVQWRKHSKIKWLGLGVIWGCVEGRLRPCPSLFHSFLIVSFVLFEGFWIFIKVELSLEEKSRAVRLTEKCGNRGVDEGEAVRSLIVK